MWRYMLDADTGNAHGAKQTYRGLSPGALECPTLSWQYTWPDDSPGAQTFAAHPRSQYVEGPADWWLVYDVFHGVSRIQHSRPGWLQRIVC